MSRYNACILVVEDDETVRELVAAFLSEEGYETVTAYNGVQALEMLDSRAIDLVISDVRMPGMDGIALLAEISHRHPQTGVLLLTGCEDVSMAVRAMKNGALDYVLKPFELRNLAASVERALATQREKQRSSQHLKELEGTVERQSGELRQVVAALRHASAGTLEALVAALDAREHETQAHSQRVSEYTVYLAGLMGVDSADIANFRNGALLHDIGKIGISDSILLKPGELNEAEWSEMRKHPQIGYWILNAIEALRPAAEIVLSHHEHFDGLGYPRRLKGREIPLGARIFSVVDSFDAIISDRPYRRGESYSVARREIEQNSGSQFDPEVVAHFLTVPAETWTAIARAASAAQPPPLPDLAPMEIG